MDKAARYKFVLDCLGRTAPPVDTELQYGSVYELTVAVMLSAQCTDKRVNSVTPALFAAFPDAQTLAAATPDDVLPYMSSVSYPNSKARHLVGMAQKVCADFNGQIPRTLEGLTSLPGVGRKTANVVLAVGFGKEALAVDTHVFRVSRRLGLVEESHDTPLKVETELMRHIPHGLVAQAHFQILLHGRYVCKARKPECGKCGLAGACEYFSKEKAMAAKAHTPAAKARK